MIRFSASLVVVGVGLLVAGSVTSKLLLIYIAIGVSAVALLFLIPGSGSTLRVNGHAQVSADPVLLNSFRMEDKAPRTVIVMTVQEIYFQCARAIVRSDLWNPDKRVDPKTLPTPGQILAEMSENRVGGEQYDREWPERARHSMW